MVLTVEEKHYKWPDSETLTQAGQYLAIQEILERQGTAQCK